MRATASDPVMARREARGEAVHAFRPSLFIGERRFRVDGSRLEWSGKHGEDSVPLSDIVRMHIYHAPAAADRTVRRTILRLRDGRKLVIQSNHFVKLATFEDRLESYTALVDTLLERLTAANPSLQVLIGTPTGLWATYLVLVVGSVAVLLVGAILAIVGEFPLGAAVSLAIVAGFLPLCWRVVRGGRAHPVDLAAARQTLAA